MSHVAVKGKRDKIYTFIQENPGLHLREIQRRLRIPLSTLEYHVNKLYLQDKVHVIADGGYTRYYAWKINEREHLLISCLRRERPREILTYCMCHGETSFTDLSDYLSIKDPTLSYHLSNLKENDVIIENKLGGTKHYRIKDTEKIEKLIKKYPGSFFTKN